MATYNPPSFPRPKSGSILGTLLYQIRLAYFQYSVSFGLYVMTPMEKLVFNSVVLGFLSLVIFYAIPLVFASIARVATYVMYGSGQAFSMQSILQNADIDATFLVPGDRPTSTVVALNMSALTLD